MDFFKSIPVWDLIFGAILLVSVIITARKGAFRAIGGLAGTILGWIGAFRLLDKVQPVTQRLLFPILRRTVERSVESAGVGELLQSGTTQDILGGLGRVLDALGLSVTTEEVAAAAQDFAGNLTDGLATALTRQIAPIVTFLALFILIKLAVSIILNILSLDIPVLRTINSGLGALLGLLSGAVVVLALCWGIARFAPEEDLGPINRTTLAESYIGGFTMKFIEIR